MSLKFIYGNSGSGKTKYCIDEIISLGQADKTRMHYVIVPEQFTLKTQQALTSAAPGGVIMNVDVVSFGRLAYRIFDELGIEATVMEEIGKDLVLRRLAAQKEDSLKLFKGNLRRMGYIDQVKSVITELMQYDISPEELSEIIEGLGGQTNLSLKLTDIHTMYEGFTDYMKDKFVVAEQVLDILVNNVDRSKLLRDAVILLDGFTGFTPLQVKLLHKLMGVVKDIYVTVTLDSDRPIFEELPMQDLFFMSSKMVQALNRAAADTGFTVDKPIVISPSKLSRHGENETLTYLERNIFRHSAGMPGFDPSAISLTSLDNPVKEVEYAAVSIVRLMQEKGYKYKDFAIVCAAVDTYERYASGVFKKYNIPCYIDVKKPVIDNPFISFLRSAMQMIVKDFSYESVFSFLRTGLTDIDAESIDELENYCIAKGVKGHKKWENSFKSPSGFGSGVKLSDDEKAEKLLHINEIRKSFWETVSGFYKGFQKSELTIKDMTVLLYELCVTCDVERKLRERSEAFDKSGEELRCDEYKQIYKFIMGILEKTAALLGDEVIEARDYADILDAGFGGAEIGMIPTDGDCVIFGDIERTRLDDVKVLFLIGANDSLIPKKTDRGSILSQYDRDCLAQNDVELAPSAREQAFYQRFYLYLNLTKPADAINISYSRTDSDGKSVSPSYLIALIKKIYVGLEVNDIGDDYKWPAINEGSAIDAYLAGLSRIKEIEPDKEWKALRKWLLSDDQMKIVADELFDAAFFEAGEADLTGEASTGLYGKILQNSVSRLEEYAKCAFAHFLNYGLKLSEREEAGFSSLDMGTFFHEVIKGYSECVEKSETFDWYSVTEADQDVILDAVMEEVILKLPNDSFVESERGRYALERIRRIMRRSIWAITKQIQSGEFKPFAYELPFGMEYVHKDDTKMKLIGKIDRLDLCETEDKIYVRIVDYKSGNKDVELLSVYYGQQLQLVMYLNGAIELIKKKYPDKEVLPGGIFYYHFDDPMLDEPADDEVIAEKLFKSLKLKGLLYLDKDSYLKMDTSLDEGVASDVIPIAINKGGALAKATKGLVPEDFEVVQNYANEKSFEAGEEIISGKVEINPYRLKDKTGCDYCSFKSICGFDLRIPGCEYNDLQSMEVNEILEKMSN